MLEKLSAESGRTITVDGLHRMLGSDPTLNGSTVPTCTDWPRVPRYQDSTSSKRWRNSAVLGQASSSTGPRMRMRSSVELRRCCRNLGRLQTAWRSYGAVWCLIRRPVKAAVAV